MTPVTITMGLALVLIVVGLVMIVLAKQVDWPLLAMITRIAGIILLVVGLVLLLTPVLVWLNVQLRAMLGIS